MRQALCEAARDETEVPVGALIIRDGRVVASAHNEREGTHDPLAHAEILAIRKACEALGTRRLSGCTLFVTLEPCPMCAGALVMAGLDACVFGAYDARYGCCGSVYDIPQDPAFTHHVRVTGGVLKAECETALKTFFANKRNIR